MTKVTNEYLNILESKGVKGFNYEPSDTGADSETPLRDYTNVTSGYIILKANTGYKITQAYYRDLDGFISDYVISSDGLTATCDDIECFASGFTLETKQLTPNVQGVNQVYELDEKGVSVISSKQFIFFNGQKTLQYGDYLLGLIKIPFPIPNNIIVNQNTNVKLGDYDTGVKGKLINGEKLIVDIGSITTALKYNNTLDFINTTCILYLPFCEPITIESEFVIGQTISIKYIVNLYNGEMLINISSSKNDEVIITKNIDLDVDVPFANVTNRPPKNDSRDISLGKDNGLRNAHIVIMQNTAVLPYGFFTVPITDEKKLLGEQGFVKIENIRLQTLATNEDKQNILNLLRDGVIIK